MSETAHTPGPWVANLAEEGSWMVYTDDGAIVADAMGYGGQCEGDARLIAAAPELLDSEREFDRLSLVIESTVRNADPGNHAAVLAAIKANRAAIAKATNQQEKV